MSLNTLRIVPETNNQDSINSEFAGEEYEKILSELEQRLEPKPIETLLPEKSYKDFTVPLRIEPLPGFILSTVTASKSEKYPSNYPIFVNICHSPDFPKPPKVTEQEIQKALNADPTSNYQIPLSLTEPRTDTNDGKACLVFDACIHSEPFQRSCQDFDFRLYIIELAIEWVEEKNKLELRREFTLPAGSSKGPLAPHTIPVTKSAPVTEITSIPPKKDTPTTLSPKTNTPRVPEYRIQEIPGLTGPSNQLHISIMLPELVSCR
ncbi:hypothetical protein K7432_005254 [Basidiobolus ranarum]|uniref:PIH1 N-terminal domain-containing protein n=1 Tax=Basidiobolus ranarum TaxID=34480 RepID=A0ABR2WWZ6_9FUNG